MFLCKTKRLKKWFKKYFITDKNYYIFCNNCKNSVSDKPPVYCLNCKTLMWCSRCAEYNIVRADQWCCDDCTEIYRINYINISTRKKSV